MRLKVTPLGVVRPAHGDEPFFLEGGPGMTGRGVPQPSVGSLKPRFPGSPSQPAARPERQPGHREDSRFRGPARGKAASALVGLLAGWSLDEYWLRTEEPHQPGEGRGRSRRGRTGRRAHRGRRGITTSSPCSPTWTNSTTQQLLAAAPAGPRSLSHFRQNATTTHLDTTPTEPGRQRTPVRYRHQGSNVSRRWRWPG